jgi:predicted alpha/beta-hydrolase family hydrolase
VPLEIETPHGLAHVHLNVVDKPRGALVLAHGAGGGVNAPDLVAATSAAREDEWTVALVEHPYRVAGKRTPPRSAVLDATWISILARLSLRELVDLPLVTGGRSLGGRVACRTADQTSASGVVCLAFPLEPPRRGSKPQQSRLDELDAVRVSTLVVQGENDPYGIPPPGPSRQVVIVPGDHGLKKDPDAVAEAVRTWLATAVPAGRRR